VKQPYVILGDASGELVRRKVVVFHRLEPGDSPTMGFHPLRESPYLEGKIVEIALGKAVHDDMVRLSKAREAALGNPGGLFASYDLAGMLISGAGGGLFGVWLDYLPIEATPYLLGALAMGTVLGFVTRVRRRAAELAAMERWKAAPEQKEFESLARELSEKWIAFSLDVKKELGCHTEVRVAEGSDDPLRLASIDPRGFVSIPPTFDPEDFLPTEGVGVRYEAVHAQGEVVTRLCEGDRDLPDGKAYEKKSDSPTTADEKADAPTKADEEADAKAASADDEEKASVAISEAPADAEKPADAKPADAS
jgi:hypothetical protein